MEESVRRVAARIKRWRSEASLSLQELANRSDVSPSTIHKIEHVQTVPTIAVVLKLAAGLGRHATELFEDSDQGSSTILIRADERRELRTSRGARIQALAGDPTSRELGVWRIVHPPGFSFGQETLSHVTGEVVIYVESGELNASVGDENFELAAGDSLHFKASSAYAWRNDGSSPAVAIIMGNTSDALRPALASQMRRSGTPTRDRTDTGTGAPVEPSPPLAARG